MADTPELDLNKLSTDDLIALKSGDLNKVSTNGLMFLKSAQPKVAQQGGNIISSDVPTVVGEVANPKPIQSPPTTMMDKLKALYEVPTAMASGMVAQPVGAAYGVAKGILGPKTPEAMQEAQQAGGQLAKKLQYQPTSPASQEVLQGIGSAMEAAKIPPYLGNIGAIPSFAQKAPNVKPVMQETVMPVANRMAGALRQEGQMVREAAQPALNKISEVAAPVTNKLSETLRRMPEAPTSEELLQQSKQQFAKAQESGMSFKPEAFSTKMAEIGADLRKTGYTPPPPGGTDPYPKITGALYNLTNLKNPKDFEELSTLRTIIRTAQKSKDETERKLGTVLKDNFDDYIINAPETDIAKGTKEGAQAWKSARDTWSRLSKSEVFEDILDKSEINASRISPDKYIRNKLQNLASDDTKMRLFTPTEQAAIEKAAKGGPVQNFLSLAGKYSPENMVGLATGSYIGAELLGPGGSVIAPIAAGAANAGAKALRRNELSRLAALMRAEKKE